MIDLDGGDRGELRYEFRWLSGFNMNDFCGDWEEMSVTAFDRSDVISSELEHDRD